MKRKLLPAGAGVALGALVVPASAMADSLDAANNGVLGESVPLNTLWVVISAVLVLFMLAGLLSSVPGPPPVCEIMPNFVATTTCSRRPLSARPTSSSFA